jgi:hypothetical protein
VRNLKSGEGGQELRSQLVLPEQQPIGTERGLPRDIIPGVHQPNVMLLAVRHDPMRIPASQLLASVSVELKTVTTMLGSSCTEGGAYR